MKAIMPLGWLVCKNFSRSLITVEVRNWWPTAIRASSFMKSQGKSFFRVYDLKLDPVKSSVTLENLLDYILQTSRPATLSSFSTSKSDLPELVRKKPMAREKDLGCCTYNVAANKCWRHFLDKIETKDLVNGTSISEWIAQLMPFEAFNVDCF
ncbi:uncharacterized protein LOC120196369 [Hibiscus syriacus]|uniref:uncharacterized protein LOC120196369 n=1 Tax=Hibiscus syriacus TaxID=106335 RepID=UPI001922D3E8|nr:uncharacterized protein LOC120196369 [Hibiscus syriacus]